MKKRLDNRNLDVGIKINILQINRKNFDLPISEIKKKKKNIDFCTEMVFG